MKTGYIQGKILIEITGLGANRFINICHHHNIYLRKISVENNSLKAVMKAGDLLKCKEIIKTTGVKLRILKKYGLPFWYFKHRNRYIFAVGVAAFLGIVIFLSNFIWKIKVNGNLYYSDNTIIEFLYDNNISVGVQAGIINESELEELIRSEFDRIIWVSVSVNGTKLSIDVKENNTNPIMDEQNVVNDIIATCDGVIESITVRTGTPIVDVGDEVRKGDVLVMSKVECTNESMEVVKTVYTNADADIMINTLIEYEDVLNRNYITKEYTGEMEENQFTRIGNKIIENKNFNCSFENYDTVVDYKQIATHKNFICPIYYGYIYYREYQLIEKSYSDNEIKAILEENLTNYLNKLQENSIQINNNSVKIEMSGYSGRAYGVINTTQPAIDYQEPIIIEEIEETEGTE